MAPIWATDSRAVRLMRPTALTGHRNTQTFFALTYRGVLEAIFINCGVVRTP